MRPAVDTPWQLALPAEAASIPEIRAGVTDFARLHGAGESTVGDIALAVTEAATNAVVHAFVGMTAGTVTVTVHARAGSVVVQVVDDGRGMRPRTDSPGLGLGLPMMAQLTTSCDIREARGGVGTDVRMTFAAPGVHGAEVTGDAEDEGRLRVLSEVVRITDGGGWPSEGVERLIELLVPTVADAGAIDLVDEAGRPERVAAKVAGEGGAELSRWLAARRPRDEQVQAVVAALRTGEWHLIEVADGDEQALAQLAHDDKDAKAMSDVGTAWWLNLPLGSGDVFLGSLGLGFRRERGDPTADRAYLEALAARVAHGLAHTRLITELRRTRRRLERILSSLAEAVTIADEDGRLVYANDAALELLGAGSADEVVGASAAELMGRFDVTLSDGTPVETEDLPGRRALSGRFAEPLLTRAVDRATGRVRWLVTKSRLLDDDGPLSVNIVEDVTDQYET